MQIRGNEYAICLKTVFAFVTWAANLSLIILIIWWEYQPRTAANWVPNALKFAKTYLAVQVLDWIALFIFFAILWSLCKINIYEQK